MTLSPKLNHDKVSIAATKADCELNWKPFTIGDRKTCLRNVGQARLNESVAMCDGLGAFLPIPRNEQEDRDFYAAIQSGELGQLGHVALDATDAVNEGVWVDSTGNTLNYFNWGTGQPDNANGVEHYLHYTINIGTWNDNVDGFIADVVCWKPEINGKFCEKLTFSSVFPAPIDLLT